MIKNYIKIALRSILRSKTYSVINILGLSAGLASFLIILLYLNYELSYDKWHRDLGKVYRVSLKQQADISNQTPVPLGRLIVQNYPNAEAATVIMANGDFEILISAGEKAIYQKDVVTADSFFLKVFPYKLKVGDAATALNAPNAAILSEDVASKLFGNTDPIGKQIKVHNAIDCIVTGIMQDPTTPSHLPVKMLIRNPYEKQNYHWQNYSYQTYLKVKHIEAEQKLEDNINKLYRERLKSDNQPFEPYHSSELFVDAIPNIHNFPKYGNSQFTTISVLLVLAGLLLLAGAINFSNLAIAKALSRAKEVGVRKVLGSSRKQLIAQLMTETTLQCLMSLVLASLIVSLVLPYVNQLFNIHLSFWITGSYHSFILQMTLCLLVVISFSGLYPSLFLSHYSAAKVLSGEYSRGKKGVLFQK